MRNIKSSDPDGGGEETGGEEGEETIISIYYVRGKKAIINRNNKRFTLKRQARYRHLCRDS